jgi:hypothetical protein
VSIDGRLAAAAIVLLVLATTTTGGGPVAVAATLYYPDLQSVIPTSDINIVQPTSTTRELR